MSPTASVRDNKNSSPPSLPHIHRASTEDITIPTSWNVCEDSLLRIGAFSGNWYDQTTQSHADVFRDIERSLSFDDPLFSFDPSSSLLPSTPFNSPDSAHNPASVLASDLPLDISGADFGRLIDDSPLQSHKPTFDPSTPDPTTDTADVDDDDIDLETLFPPKPTLTPSPPESEDILNGDSPRPMVASVPRPSSPSADHIPSAKSPEPSDDVDMDTPSVASIRLSGSSSPLTSCASLDEDEDFAVKEFLAECMRLPHLDFFVNRH